MNDGKSSIVAQPSRFRLRLSTLFWLQVLLAPAFMPPFYRSGVDLARFHPDLMVALSFLAPAAYVLVLVIWAARARRLRISKSLVGLILIGAAYGAMYFLLAFAPLGLPHAIENPWIIFDSDLLLELTTALAVFAAFGGAFGLAVGTARELFRWRRRHALPHAADGEIGNALSVTLLKR